MIASATKKAQAQAPANKPKKVFFFMIERGVTDAKAKLMARQLAGQSIYWPEGPSPFVVTRMPGISIENIERTTLPLLRIRYPQSPIIFLYGKSQIQEYARYIYAKYNGTLTAQGLEAFGNTDISKGYALAPAWQWTDVHHELLHLAKCLHHKYAFDDPATWWRDANAEKYPWCMCSK